MASPRLSRTAPRRAGLDGAELATLAAEVTALTEGPRPWCAAAVVAAGRGPHLVLEHAAGWAVRYRRYDPRRDAGEELPRAAWQPARPDTVFDLASISKLFTTVAAAQQWERGTLDLDRPVAAYVEEFGAAGKERITVRHLLTHTSGLRPELPLAPARDRRDPLEPLWREAPLRPPGSGRCYSDLNFLALQRVLERVTGSPLDRLVAEGITGPLGMADTRYGPLPDPTRAAATEDQRRPWAKADRGMLRGVVHDENAAALGGVAGHAGLFATARDLTVLCRALLAGGRHGDARILAPDTVRLLLTPPGLGFAVDQPAFMGELAGRGAAGHTGFTGTSLVVDPATGTFLVLLATTVHPVRRPPDSGPRAAAATRLARAVRDPLP